MRPPKQPRSCPPKRERCDRSSPRFFPTSGGFGMQYCHKERSNFPDNQFSVERGVRMHAPIGKSPHRADRKGPGPLRPPTRARRRFFGR
jgi:hypothetical protein